MPRRDVSYSADVGNNVPTMRYVPYDIRARLETRLRRLDELAIPFPQNVNEFAMFCLLLACFPARPVSYLEIGCRHGGSLYAASGFLPEHSLIIGMDLPGAAWGDHESEPSLRLIADELTREGYDAHLILADSSSSEAKQELSALLAGRHLDAIFIDADHTFLGVSSDWNNYRTLVASPGMVAFHDIARRSDTPKVEVYQLWEELRNDYPHLEVIWQYGIGAIWLNT